MIAGIGKRYPAPAWARGGPAALRIRAAYESAAVGRRTLGWSAPTLGPNDATLPSIRTLRDRARKAYRDDPYGGGAIDTRVEQLIGTGITPKSLAPDEKFREYVQQRFAAWAEESADDGTLDFYGQQTQIARGWEEVGEIFARFRDRQPDDVRTVPLQLQVLEAEFCPVEHTLPGPGQNRIRAGVEFTPFGRRSAYWFYRQRPGDAQDLNTSELVRLPADRVLHVFTPKRAGQIRGVTQLHRSLMTMRDLDLGDDATLLRWQLSNMLVGWLKRNATGAEPVVDPITGKALSKNADGVPEFSLRPGSFYDLLPGEDIGFSEPPEAGNTYEAFMRQQLRKIAVATRTPYHALTGDMAQVNDRTIRVILQDFRRGLEQLQWQVMIFQFCRPVWETWFRRGVTTGTLVLPVSEAEFNADPATWMAVEWYPDRFGYIHPVQDVQADRDEVRSGFASRSAKVKARGYDVEQIDRERAEDNAREERLGLVSESDPAKTDGSGKLVSADASAEPDDPPSTRDDQGRGRGGAA